MSESSKDIANVKLPSPESVIVVVRDIDKTIEMLSSKWGIGPWERDEYAPTKDELLVGEPFKLNFAFTKLGSLILQLTQPVEGKTIWADFLKTKGEGLFSFYYSLPNWEETVERFKKKGMKMIAGGIYAGKRWCIFDLKPGGIVAEFGES